MQTGAADAVAVPGGEPSDHLAGRHGGAHREGALHRQVGGPQRRSRGRRGSRGHLRNRGGRVGAHRMGDRDHRPPGHRPGERHDPRRRGPDLRARGGGQVDAAVSRTPWLRRRLEAADHGTRPPVRTVHRPPPRAPALTPAHATPPAPATPATAPGTLRRVPERPGPQARQQRDQDHRYQPAPPPPTRSDRTTHRTTHDPHHTTHRTAHRTTHDSRATRHDAEGPRGSPARPPLPRFLWTTGPCGRRPSPQRVDRVGCARLRRGRHGPPAEPSGRSGPGSSPPARLPRSRSVLGASRTLHTRPGPPGRLRTPRHRWSEAAQPPPPPGASAARSAEPGRSPDRRVQAARHVRGVRRGCHLAATDKTEPDPAVRTSRAGGATAPAVTPLRRSRA